MYTFADTEYKWCPQCAGNIRQQATHCRFCRKPIENRLMKKVVLQPFVTVRTITEWLPNFTELKDKLPMEFRTRLEQAEAEAPKIKIGTPLAEQRLEPGLANLCPHDPPEPNIIAILTDMLLSLYANDESVALVCDCPQMKLLEITPQEIAAEHELRKEEMKQGHRCSYCKEFIFANSDECRFCEGTEDKAPVAVERTFEKTVDPLFLKDVILYEAAWRILNEENSLSQEILAANSCSQSDVDEEVLRQRGGNSEPPIPRFTRRMVKLNLFSYWTPEQISLMALADLGSALDSKKEDRSDEALIVFEHALRRTEGKEELMSQRSSILTGLSTYYVRKKDDAKYQLFNSMAHECSKFGMTDEMKAIMDKSHERIKNTWSGKLEPDPEKRLASLDTDYGMNLEGMDEMLAQLEETLPGMGELFTSLQSGMEETMKTTRLIIEAQVADKNGNLAEAEAKYKEALENTNEDRLTGMTSKISILCSLGEVKQKQGDSATAESLLTEALEIAKEYAEAEPALGKASLFPTLTSHACLLKEAGRYEESEQQFQTALQVEEESTSRFIEAYGGERGDYSAQKADIKEKYAQLLRAMKRDEDAAKLDAEVAQLRKEAEERQAEIQARHSR